MTVGVASCGLSRSGWVVICGSTLHNDECSRIDRVARSLRYESGRCFLVRLERGDWEWIWLIDKKDEFLYIPIMRFEL